MVLSKCWLNNKNNILNYNHLNIYWIDNWLNDSSQNYTRIICKKEKNAISNYLNFFSIFFFNIKKLRCTNTKIQNKMFFLNCLFYFLNTQSLNKNWNKQNAFSQNLVVVLQVRTKVVQEKKRCSSSDKSLYFQCSFFFFLRQICPSLHGWLVYYYLSTLLSFNWHSVRINKLLSQSHTYVCVF